MAIDRPRQYGLWLIALACACGIAWAVYAYFRDIGINHTWGVIVVIVSSLLMLLVTLLLLGQPGMRAWLRGLLLCLVLLDIFGTGLAGWFLEAPWMMACMAAALLGWLLHLFAGPHRPVAPATQAEARTAA